MNDIKLIFFEGCPNAERVRQALQESEIEFVELDQNILDGKDDYNNYTSPTVIKNDKVILGGEANGGGCSLGIPTTEEFNKILSKL